MKFVGYSLMLTVCMAMILGGCASTMTWVSRPEIQNAGNPVYDVQLEPLTEGNAFFTFFRVTVRNKTDQPIRIDWNRTRYIREGKGFGTFIYRGVKTEDYQNGTIPFDVVGPGETFSRNVAPMKLVTVARLKERVGEGESFSPGILPDGENGMMLAVNQNGREIPQKISVTISSKPMK
jgi:hypothetical protein